MTSQEESITTTTAQYVSTTVDHPHSDRTDAESVRRFLNLYNQYVNEAKARARQLGDGLNTEASKPVVLKYCVDVDVLKSTLALGLNDSANDYDTINENALRQYLEKEAEDFRETLTLSGLDSIVRKDLKMDMKNKDARSRMKSLLIEYHTLLRRNGLYWLLEDKEKVAVQHVLSEIQSVKLRNCL